MDTTSELPMDQILQANELGMHAESRGGRYCGSYCVIPSNKT
jgi:hypothetical protein